MDSIKDTVLGGIGILKHYIGLANKENVAPEELQKRFDACQNCPSKTRAFYGADTCGICGCPLYQKLPLMYDPKATEQKGELVINRCPAEVSKW